MDSLYAHNILLCERSVEPSEILWQNLFGKRGLFVLRRGIIYFIGFIVIFFLTTPAVILSNMDFLKVFEQDGTHATLLRNLISPFCVVMVN